jgi:ubiquinone/menaquinone biosynthesis C-methylase UbiE
MNYFSPQQYRGSSYQAQALFYWWNTLKVKTPKTGKYKLLDAGCGDGVIAKWLLENNPSMHLIGFDASEKQIQGARDRCKEFRNRCTFITATFDSFLSENVVTEEEPVDLVVANYSLHLAPSMNRAVGNLARCLKSEVKSSL